MKILLAAITLTVVATAVEAEEPCDSIAVMAEAIMSSRQSGVDMSKVMGVIKKSPLSKGGEITLFEDMVIEAYDSPRYGTKAVQGRAIADFKNGEYLDCVKAMRILKDK